MLHVVPQTSVTVDGRDAQAGDLQEGQPVRASFNDVEGQPTAVQIQAGQGATDSSGSTGTGTMSDPGTYAPDPNAPNAPGAAGTPEGGAGSRSGSNPAQESTPPITEKRR
jgi:hypothetical protein